MFSGHLLVAPVLLPLRPPCEVVPSDREDDVDDPLARELGVLPGFGQVRLHFGVVRSLLQDGADVAALVMGDVEVPNLAALNVLLLAADDVCTSGYGRLRELTFEEVDGHGVVRRQVGSDLHGQELEGVLLGLVMRAELGRRYLLFVAHVHNLNFNWHLINYNFERYKHVSAAQVLLPVNQVCFVTNQIY